MATSRSKRKPPSTKAVAVVEDPRVSPVRGMPRSKIIRVSITEHWGAKYIKGRTRTYRLYPQENRKWTNRVLDEIKKDLDARCSAAEKDGENEDPNT